MSSDKTVLGLFFEMIGLVVLGNLIFWGGIIYLVLHFAFKILVRSKVMKKVTFYCDSSAVEMCIYNARDDSTLIRKHSEEILNLPVEKRVNIGEYNAVLCTMELARNLGVTNLEIQSDSQLVVNQVSGARKCRHSHLQSVRDKIRARSQEFDSFTLRWVSRDENPAGFILERKKR